MPVTAVAGVNQQINFQGRLLNSAGAIVADGDYHIKFRITKGGNGCINPNTDIPPCGGTEQWIEERTAGNRVNVKNGYFSVNLGSVTAFGSSVDWNDDTLWVSIEIGGSGGSPAYDNQMEPFKRLAANPYALNSKYLGGLDQTQFVQLAQGVQTDSSTANPSIFINKTGITANILQLQRGGVDKLVVSNAGHTTVGGDLTVVANTTLTGTVTLGVIQGGSPLSFEGATANDFETTFAITDPTVDRTITFPNADITVNAAGQLSGDTLAAGVITSSFTTVGALVAGSITSNFGAIDVGNDNITTTGTLQGSTVTSPSATNLTLDSATGTIAIASTDTTIQKSGTALTIDLNSGSPSTLTVTNAGAGVTSLDIEGSINIGSGQLYKIGGTQISSAALSDSADLAKLATSQTFTGTNTFQPTTNITSLVVKQTSNASPTADIFNLQTTNSTNILQATSVAANSSAVTLQSVGSNALTLNSGSGTIVLGSDTTTLQKVGTAFTLDLNNASASTLTVTNSGAGAGHLSVKTSVLTPLLDTPSGTTTLNIGTTNATVGINLNQATTIAAAKNFTVTSGATDLKGATGGTALTVTNSAAGTGTIAIFNDGATPVATIANGGAVTLQNQANSTSALAVLNAAGTTIVKVDTTNSALLPGASPVAGAVTDTSSAVAGVQDIVIGADGMPIMVFVAVGNDLKIQHCTTANCSSVDAATTLVSSVDVGFSRKGIAIGRDNFPIVSYYDDTNDDLKVVHCTNIACSSFDTPTTIDSHATDTIGVESSIAIGIDGLPIVSYSHNTAGDLKVAHCTNASCSSFDTPTTVDNTALRQVGSYNSIALGTDGLPIISYYDSTDTTGQNLKVAKCTDIKCSATPTITEVDTTGDVGMHSRIVIGHDGLPVVVYRVDSTNGFFDVKYTRCGNIKCSSGNITTTITTLAVATEANVAIGNDGSALVVYYGVGDGNSKAIKCGNPNCSSGSISATITGFEGVALAIGTDGLPILGGSTTIYRCSLPSCSTTGANSGGTLSGGTSIGSTGNYFNNIYAAQFWGRQFQIANFDLAEEYPVNDPTIGPGDVVCTDQSGSLAVTRCPATSNPSLSLTPMGIVSTKPAITLGDWPTQDRTNLRPIALAGRVPTKVTSEHGPIAIGDYLTTSPTKPGYATKAIYPGPTIGTALEPLTCPVIPTVVEGSNPDCTGTITVFVKSSYYDPSTQLQGNLRTFDAINVTGVATVQELKVIGSTTLANLTVTGHITAGPDTSGTITIPAGATSATYTFAQVYGGVPRIFVTPKHDLGTIHYDIAPSALDWKINLSAPAPTDLSFSFVATAEATHE